MKNNISAFLSAVSYSEGTSRNPDTENDGYDVIVTGIDGKYEIFTDYSTHPFANGRPPKIINSEGLKSTASGRYQLLVHWFEAYKIELSLPDFSPSSQDAIAIRQITERNALGDVKNGNIAYAILKCSNIWASLPGNTYGQPTNDINDIIKWYVGFGGVLP